MESREGFLEEMTSRLETHPGLSKGRWVKKVPDRGRSMHKGPELSTARAQSSRREFKGLGRWMKGSIGLLRSSDCILQPRGVVQLDLGFGKLVLVALRILVVRLGPGAGWPEELGKEGGQRACRAVLAHYAHLLGEQPEARATGSGRGRPCWREWPPASRASAP